MGMPSSRRHIAALRRSKAAHERSQKLDAGLDGPVTKREYRYLKARAKIYGYELTMPYFKGQRREYYYGVGIEDDWPREPMLGVATSRATWRRSSATSPAARAASTRSGWCGCAARAAADPGTHRLGRAHRRGHRRPVDRDRRQRGPRRRLLRPARRQGGHRAARRQGGEATIYPPPVDREVCTAPTASR